MRCEVAEGLVGTDGVVDAFPLSQFAVELFHLQGTGGDLVELFDVSAVGALDRAIEFGGAWWQDKQVQATLLASQLELGGELGTAIDLQGAGWGRACGAAGFPGTGGKGSGTAVGLDDVPARNHITDYKLSQSGESYGLMKQTLEEFSLWYKIIDIEDITREDLLSRISLNENALVPAGLLPREQN